MYQAIPRILLTTLLYALSGGFIGGFYCGTLALINDMVQQTGIKNELFLPLGFGLMGIIFGFIPALLTGLWVGIRYLKRNKWHYLEMFVIGSIVSIIIMGMQFKPADDFLTVLLWASTGGISSIICGRLFLSKQQRAD